jgi:hypothetical protein
MRGGRPHLSRLAETRTSSARQVLANAAKSEIASASLAACAELVKDDALLTQGASTATAATHSPAERLSLYRERVLAHLELQKAGHAQYNAEEAAVDDLRFHREKLSVASTKPEFSSLSNSFSANEALQTSLKSLETMVSKGFQDMNGAIKELKADMADQKKELKADMADLKKELKADVASLKCDIAFLRRDVDGLTVSSNVLGARLQNSTARSDDALEMVQNEKGEYPPGNSFPATWNELRALSDGAIIDILGHYEPQTGGANDEGMAGSAGGGGGGDRDEVTRTRSGTGRRNRVGRAAPMAGPSGQHRGGDLPETRLTEEERVRKRRRLHQILGASPDIAVNANWTWTA